MFENAKVLLEGHSKIKQMTKFCDRLSNQSHVNIVIVGLVDGSVLMRIYQSPPLN